VATSVGIRALRPRPSAIAPGLRRLGPRRVAAAIAAAAVVALLIGVPNDLIATPLFHRDDPASGVDYAVWAAGATLAGLVFASFLEPGGPGGERRALGGTVLTLFAVGCPVCNAPAVALLGTSGALSIFAPVQPLLAIAALALLGFTLAVRLTYLDSCPR
jgi:hypothetical protein